MSKVKILTGWSNPGGSTQSFIQLTNLLNMNNYDCTLYGPHNYHLDKCKSGLFQNLDLTNDDILICHFLPNLTTKLQVKKLILSLHEKDLFPLKERAYQIYDKIHYLNEDQRSWHGVDHPYFICPNVHEPLEKIEKTVSNVAGIIGTIDRNKQTHASIIRAIADNMEQILIFGEVTDHQYFEQYVKPFLSNPIVKMVGFQKNKQLMYSMVSDVYMSSLSENQSYVADECFMTGTKFHGNDAVKEVFEIKDNKYVLEKWIYELEL
jgi:hypothetical protein